MVIIYQSEESLPQKSETIARTTNLVDEIRIYFSTGRRLNYISGGGGRMSYRLNFFSGGIALWEKFKKKKILSKFYK